MRKVLLGMVAAVALYTASSEAAPVNVCGVTNFGNCIEPTAAGAVTEMPADAVNFNNSTLANGTVTNGLFSSGAVTNPSSSQVIIGPIDTTGAASWQLYYTVTSGSGAVLAVQQGPTAAGPWTSTNGQQINTNALSVSLPSAGGTYIGSAAQKYMQVVVTTGATEVLTVQGYLRAAPYVPFLGTSASFAVTRTILAAITANGGTTAITGDSSGRLIANPYSVPELTWQYSTNGTAITTNTTTTLQGAQAASVRNYLTGITCDNSGTGAATELQILDGAAVIFDGFIGAASATLNDPHWSVTFPVPLRGSAATAMSLKTVTTGASLWCSAQGFAAY